MDYKTENAHQFLHQLLRYRYNALIRKITEKFNPTPDQVERLQNLINYQFIAQALREEDT
jgi:predicted transcriptional regulator